MRARLVSVPGLSLPYQLRISRTRSFMAIPPFVRYSVSCRVRSRPSRSRRCPQPARLAPGGVAYLLQLAFRHPAQHGGVELCVTVHTASSRVAVRVENDPDEHLLVAAGAMPHRKVPVKQFWSCRALRQTDARQLLVDAGRDGWPASTGARSAGSARTPSGSRARTAAPRSPRSRDGASTSGSLQSRQRRSSPPPSGTTAATCRSWSRKSSLVTKTCGGSSGSRTRRVSRVSNSRRWRRAHAARARPRRCGP